MTVGSKVKQTVASLKGIQATFRIYESQSQNKETKSAFAEAIETTQTVIKDLEERIRVLEFEEPQYKGK